MRASSWLRVALGSVVVTGCAAYGAGEATSDEAEALTPASFSYVGQGVLAALSANDASAQGHNWNYSGDNVLDPQFILQTPLAQYWGQSVSALPVATSCDPTKAGCDPDFKLQLCSTQSDCTGGGVCAQVAASVARQGQAAKKMCRGHSDARVDDVYNVLVQAQSFADVTSLTPADGRFEAALRNAITFLSAKANPPAVRLVFGNYPGANVVTSDVLASLTRDVPKGSAMRVSVGAYRSGLTSWNHAKIVAVDGKTAIVGGMNLWEQHYLDKDPVHDISIRVSGTAAQDAHLFANALWKFTCAGTGWWTGGTTSVSTFGGSSACPASYVPTAGAHANGATKVIGVGRLGALGNEASDDALVAMIAAARTTVRIAQQDLGPVTRSGVALDPWPTAILTEMARALGRGVDVYVVLSNPNAVAGGLGSTSGTYSNGWTIEQTAQHIGDTAHAHPEFFASGTDIDAVLCDKLHVAPIRPSADDAWPDGSAFTNHAKLVLIDGAAFYVGSQNLYIANLAEYGFIVDDAPAAAQLTSEYWSPLWTYSSRVAVTGRDAPVCIFGG